MTDHEKMARGLWREWYGTSATMGPVSERRIQDLTRLLDQAAGEPRGGTRVPYGGYCDDQYLDSHALKPEQDDLTLGQKNALLKEAHDEVAKRLLKDVPSRNSVAPDAAPGQARGEP